MASTEPASIDWQRLTALAERAATGNRAHWDALWSELSAPVIRWIEGLSYFRSSNRREDHCRDVYLETWEKLQRREHHALRHFFRGDKAQNALVRGGLPARASYFRAWLRVVVERAALDHLRRLPEYVRKRRSSKRAANAPVDDSHGADQTAPPRWRVVENLTTGMGARSQGTELTLFARQALAILDNAVTPDERRATRLRARGMSWPGIARELGLFDGEAAEKRARRASNRVHYRSALELWCASYSYAEIAEILGLNDATHAARIVKAAKEYLRRHFASRPPASR